MQFAKYVLPVVVGAMGGMLLIRLGETWVWSAGGQLPGMMMPEKNFVLSAVVYMIGSFFAGIIATLVSKRVERIPAIVVGIVLTLAGLFNMFNMLHPGWFVAVNLVVYIAFTYLGYLIARKKESVA